jgi:hypothetical protein
MIQRRLIFRDHATRRMMQRGIRARDIRFVLEHGEVIENYPDDTPYPSQLLLGWVRGRPLHVVAAEHLTLPFTFIITVYEPDPNNWEPDFTHRRPL